MRVIHKLNGAAARGSWSSFGSGLLTCQRITGWLRGGSLGVTCSASLFPQGSELWWIFFLQRVSCTCYPILETILKIVNNGSKKVLSWWSLHILPMRAWALSRYPDLPGTTVQKHDCYDLFRMYLTSRPMTSGDRHRLQFYAVYVFCFYVFIFCVLCLFLL